MSATSTSGFGLLTPECVELGLVVFPRRQTALLVQEIAGARRLFELSPFLATVLAHWEPPLFQGQ